MAAAAAPAQAAPPAEDPPPFVPKPLPPPITDADYPELYMPGYEEPPSMLLALASCQFCACILAAHLLGCVQHALFELSLKVMPVEGTSKDST